MQEPSLLAWTKQPGNAKTESYRFLWLRSFDQPVAVRIQKEEGEGIRLFTKVLTKSRRVPGMLQVDKTKMLTDEE